METLPKAPNSYLKLVDELRKEIAEGLLRAQEAYDREKVFTYWKMGAAISMHLLSENNRADYGQKLFKNLSEDLSIGERLLYQMTQFYNAYPDFKPIENLKWSHYRLLTSVKDKDRREFFEEQVSQDNWSKRKLEEALKGEKKRKRKKGNLSVFRERLYTYRIFKDECSKTLLIDLGFNVYKETELLDFDGEFIETVKLDTGYEFKKTNVKKKYLYVYKAFVKEVIDGDTLWVMIDCGFKTWIKQKIRLHKIDAPTIDAKEGMRTKEFVEKVLKDVPFIVIKCHFRDKFDRYLVDLLYLEGEEEPQVVLDEGKFLNQELLDEGLARRI